MKRNVTQALRNTKKKISFQKNHFEGYQDLSGRCSDIEKNKECFSQ